MNDKAVTGFANIMAAINKETHIEPKICKLEEIQDGTLINLNIVLGRKEDD